MGGDQQADGEYLEYKYRLDGAHDIHIDNLFMARACNLKTL
jgi:hypothetical protein